ncbi:hypothetical protein GCM10020255_104830 [Rhodococcus baikonurensis]
MTAPATQTTDNLITARVDAIENSGWGRSFTFYQPRNAAFWVYLMLVVTGAFKLFSMLSASAPAYGDAIALSIVLFGVYGAVFWWFTHHIDRYARQPVKLIVVAFLWGASLRRGSWQRTPTTRYSPCMPRRSDKRGRRTGARG